MLNLQRQTTNKTPSRGWRCARWALLLLLCTVGGAGTLLGTTEGTEAHGG